MYQPSMFENHHHILHHITTNSTHKTSESTDAPSGDAQDPNNTGPHPKRKRYHRHTQPQIQEMEAFFEECHHLDDKQRKELSRELGLEHLQVKFWFQNKRTQRKAQHERHENSILKSENDKFRAENNRYKEALSNTTCLNCGGPASVHTDADKMTSAYGGQEHQQQPIKQHQQQQQLLQDPNALSLFHGMPQILLNSCQLSADEFWGLE